MSKVYFNHTTKLSPVRLGLARPATIALRREGNDFVYGVTICSRDDNFSKKQGREIALARLNQGFRKTAIPQSLLDLEALQGENFICTQFLYELSLSVTKSNRKWRRKITSFNRNLGQNAKIVAELNSEKQLA